MGESSASTVLLAAGAQMPQSGDPSSRSHTLHHTTSKVRSRGFEKRVFCSW